MTEPTFDAGGYPTEETLQAIREWDFKSLRSCFEFIKRAWRYPDYFTIGEKLAQISTAGWSGNEELISALKDNRVIWEMTWLKIEFGGHFEFNIDFPR